MDTNHSIYSSLTHNGLSCEAERDVRMHYTEIITYLTGLSKHPGLQVSFDFRMWVSPTPFSVGDDISEISVVHENEQEMEHAEAHAEEHAEEHAEVLANIERARQEDMEAVEARHKREMAKVRAELEAQAEELREELAAARKELSGWCERCMAAQDAAETLRKELQTEVDGATRVFNVMESDIERLREENKGFKRRVAEESHWCKDANMALRTAEMHAQMLRTELAMLQKETEAAEARHKHEMAAVTSSSVKVEPSPAPKFPQVVRASPQLVAALKAEKTWNDGKDVCYALTKKDYEDMIKAQQTLPSVEDDAQLELLKKMVDVPLPPSPPSSPLLSEEGELRDQLAACEAPGCYDGAPAETKPKPNYNHHFWPSPKTKRFARHVAKHSGKDPKTIKTHEDALEFLAEKAKLSVDDLLKMSIKSYQSAHEPWSLPSLPWEFPSPEEFHI